MSPFNPNVQTTDSSRAWETPLYMAAKYNQYKLVHQLLEAGANPRQTDSFKNLTALENHVRCENLKAVKLLTRFTKVVEAHKDRDVFKIAKETYQRIKSNRRVSRQRILEAHKIAKIIQEIFV